MHLAIKAFRKLIETNATHRRGYRINDQTDDFILERAIQEIQELREQPDDAMEMGDIFGILIHYCIRKGWTEDHIETLILQKLPERFNVDRPKEVSGPQGPN